MGNNDRQISGACGGDSQLATGAQPAQPATDKRVRELSGDEQERLRREIRARGLNGAARWIGLSRLTTAGLACGGCSQPATVAFASSRLAEAG
jgi:hypothetical protein